MRVTTSICQNKLDGYDGKNSHAIYPEQQDQQHFRGEKGHDDQGSQKL